MSELHFGERKTLTSILSRVRLRWVEVWQTDHSDTASAHIFRLLTTLFVFAFLFRILTQVAKIPVDQFYSTVVIVEFAKNLRFGFNWLWAFILVSLAVFAFWRAAHPWSCFSNSTFLRAMTIAAVAVLVWQFGLLPYNHFFDQPYYVDRLLIFVFAIGVCFRPVMIIPFVLVLLPFTHQTEAFGPGAFTLYSIPLHLCILMFTVVLIQGVNGRGSRNEFFPIAFCVIATHYFYPGSGKVRPIWLLHDHISNALPANYANGWLGFLSVETLESLYGTLRYFDWPAKIGTLGIELGSVFVLLNRRLAVFLVFGWIGLHMAIFAVTGLLFWMWIVIDLTLLAYLVFAKGGSEVGKLSPLVHSVLIGIIVTGFIWASPTKLAWFDMPASYSYKVEAVTKKGERRSLPSDYFAPIDYPFALSQFHYLSDRSLLQITSGAGAMDQTSISMLDIGSVEEFERFESNNGVVHASDKARDAAESFLRRFVGVKQSGSDLVFPLRSLGPPRSFYSFPQKELLKSHEKIERVEIIGISVFYGTGNYEVVRRERLLNVEMEPIPLQR